MSIYYVLVSYEVLFLCSGNQVGSFFPGKLRLESWNSFQIISSYVSLLMFRMYLQQIAIVNNTKTVYLDAISEQGQ